MAISVAPLTTSVMNSVAQNRVGIASGVNNAVARAAGLLAIAVLGIVMVHCFDHALDQRLAKVHLSPETQQSLQAQHTKLAAISVPENWMQQLGRPLRGRSTNLSSGAFG